jgi:hypothetical protein
MRTTWVLTGPVLIYGAQKWAWIINTEWKPKNVCHCLQEKKKKKEKKTKEKRFGHYRVYDVALGIPC